MIKLFDLTKLAYCASFMDGEGYIEWTVRKKKNGQGKTMDENEEGYYIEECIANHGLQTEDVWYKAFAGLDTETENYIRNMLANKESFKQNPRITLSTIHGAKGGEADNVLLLPDITKSSLDQNDVDPDELHRLFYVAVTRAKKALHILEPRNYDRAYML